MQPLLPLEPNDIWPMSQDDLTNIFVQEKRKISEIVGLAFEHELTQHHHTSSKQIKKIESLSSGRHQSTIPLCGKF